MLLFITLIFAQLALQCSSSTVANTLEFNYFHCFLRRVAFCIEYMQSLGAITTLPHCKWRAERHARTSLDFLCISDDVECWKKCRTDENTEFSPINDTTPYVLHAPQNVTVSWLNGTSADPLSLLVRWDKVDNASAYIVQNISYYKQPVTWALTPENYEIVDKEEFKFRKDRYCFHYGFRVMAISKNFLSPFSSKVASPTLANVRLENLTVENDREFRTDAERKQAWFFSRIKSIQPWPQRLQKYILTYSFYVRWPTSTDEYYVKVRREQVAYTKNKGYKISLPGSLITSSCDGIIIIERLELTSCTSMVNTSAVAFHVNFDNQTLDTSINCTREFAIDLVNKNTIRRKEHGENPKEFISMSESTEGSYDLTIDKILLSQTNNTEMEFRENINSARNKTVQKSPYLILFPYVPNDHTFFNETNSTSSEDTKTDRSNFHNILVAVCLGVASLTISAAVLSFAYKNHLKKNLQKELYKKIKCVEQKKSLHYSGCPKQTNKDAWEIDRSKLDVHEHCKLGSGAFGAVYKGILYQETPNTTKIFPNKRSADNGYIVAVKTCAAHLGEVEALSFRQEIELMKKIGYHDRLVNILGCITFEETLLLVEEFCTQGDLLKYLRIRRKYMLKIEKTKLENHQKLLQSQSLDPDMILSLEDLLSFSWQVACGMDYLTQKGFLHRDLAARNVLVDEGRKIKIGDFGLSRIPKNDSIYFGRGGKLPVKWMAIEALKDSTFTAASDVWSFGVLLFEIITLGGAPYPDIEAPRVIDYLQLGQRMERPDNCSDELYSLMKECWDEFPENRPTFSKLQLALGRMIENLSDQDYYVCLSDKKDYYNVEQTYST